MHSLRPVSLPSRAASRSTTASGLARAPGSPAPGLLASREELIELHLPLARRVARRYCRRPDQREDIEQVAALGLVKAANRFDPDRGVAFATFAFVTIAGEIKRHFRDSVWAVHVPRDLQDRARRVDAEVERLTQRLGHAPSVAELGESLGLPVRDVVEARAASAGFRAASLDAPAEGDARRNGVKTRADVLGAVDDGYELIEDRAAIASVLPKLSERSRLMLELRFRDDLTQREIGERLGVSQMQVSRLLRRSIATLQAAA